MFRNDCFLVNLIILNTCFKFNVKELKNEIKNRIQNLSENGINSI